MILKADSTDVTTYFKLIDPTSGVPETGLVITGLDLTYIRDRAAAVKADATALAAVNSAHGDNQAIQVDATNAPGVYRVDWPDAAFATGVNRVQLVVNGVAIDPAVMEVELQAFLGTDSKALISTDAQDLSASLDVNTKKLGGTTQTGRDVGANVLLSAGSGAGQLDFTSGVVKSNLAQILGTALTETAGYIAAGFKKLFNVATPVLTAETLNQTGDSFARIGAAGASLTALGDTRIANLDAAISTRSSHAAADVKTAVEAAGSHLALVKAQTDKFAFTGASPYEVKADVVDWKGATAPAMTGDAYARAGVPAGASIAADIAAVKSDSGTILTAVDTEVASILTAVDTEIGAIKAKTDLIPASPAAVGSAMTLADGAITAAKIATGAIDADALAADAGAEIADAVWDEAQSGHVSAGTFGKYLDAQVSSVSASGSGADQVTLTLTDGSGTPIADADVWLTSDAAGANVVAGTKQTNSSGEVVFSLDAGETYYRWAQKDGWNFTNPSSFVAVAD